MAEGPKKFGAIVRSSGERTESLATAILEAQGIDVVVTKSRTVRDFTSTLMAGFGVAMERHWDWALILDADVLPFEGLKEFVRTRISDASEETICIQPLVFDKAFFAYRHAGVHLYQIDNLRASTSVMLQPGSMRPETSFLKAVERALGLKTLFDEHRFGLHDFEQNSEHLYKKSFLKARKMPTWSAYLYALWTNLSYDDDFRFMKAGLLSGMASRARNRLLRSNGAQTYWPTEIPRAIKARMEAKKLLAHPANVTNYARLLFQSELERSGRSEWADRLAPSTPSRGDSLKLLLGLL